MPSLFHSRIRAGCFISVCLPLVACVFLFTRWQGSIASAKQATPSRLNSFAASRNQTEKGVLTPAAGNTITVNSSSDVTNGTDGLCTLREAISAANNNTVSGAAAGECAAGSSSGPDAINFSGVAGTIFLTSALPDIASDLSINGPGAGALTIQRSPQGFSISIFQISFNAKATIAGLTFQGGAAPDFGNIAINSSGTLNLTDCVVSGFGLGVQNASQFTLTISNCTISGNLNGSGISNVSGTTNVVNSTVSGNDSHGGFGPGINNSGTLNVTNSTITGNRGHLAVMNGAGGTATFINSTVSNNLDGGFINNGNLLMTGGLITGNTNGGIIAGGNSVLNGVTITNNSNNSSNFPGGGGIFITGSSPSHNTTVMNCQVSNNTTNGAGGGIRNGGAKATLINTTISGNTSNIGGGLDVVDGGVGDLIAINLTITGNRANLGGGVYRESGPVKLKNSLIAGNFRLDGTTADDIFGSIDTSSSYNLIGTGSGGLTDGVNNNQVGVADPRLRPLADNGGPTFTHSLLPNSPALDAADNCVTEVSHCGDAKIPQLTTDQRGFNRLVDGPDANTSAMVDIGAYETQPGLAELPDATSNEDAQLVIPFEAGDTSTITGVTASSSNSTLVPNDTAHLSAILKGSTGLVTVLPAANLFGTTNITVTVDRTGGGSEMKTFLLTVNSSNDAPAFTVGADQSVFEDPGPQTVTNWATGLSPGPADESGQSLSFQATNNTSAVMFSSGPAIDSSGTLTYTLAPNANGSATITVVLKDNGGTANGGVDTSAPQTFKINVTPVNDAPTFTAPDRTVNEDFFSQIPSVWATNVSAGAPDESGQSLTFQITNNSNPGLFSAGPTVRFDGALSFTPVSNASGSAIITILLKDNGGTANGGSDTSPEKTFTITVNPVNDAPSFSKGPNQTVLINAGPQSIANWATNISKGPADESGQTVNFQVTAISNPSLFTVLPAISPTGTLTYQAAPNTAGATSISINLKDDGGTANGGRDTSAIQSFAITVAAVLVKFDAATATTSESSPSTTLSVSRTGDLSRSVTVDYATSGDFGEPCSLPIGVASPKCDFTSALGTLTFAPGEATKTITVLLNQDSYVEGSETFDVGLSKATNGSSLASPASARVTIDDDVVESSGNSLDDAETFVRQHYHDFLNREPDQSGLAFWTNQITACGADTACIELKRINVSAAFYLSIEFQQTGYLVERIYKAAYGDASGSSTLGGAHQLAVPIVRANEFLFDTQEIGKGVVVNVGDWQLQLENNKQAFTAEFVQRSRFTTAYPATMTAAQFVDKLNTNAGNPLSQSERDQLVNDLSAGVKTRAQVLRAVAEDSDLFNAETNRAFVLMQYFGYMRRNPDDPQDNDYTGYDFWLTKLNQFNGNFVNADMVKAFITSGEYRHRFGP